MLTRRQLLQRAGLCTTAAMIPKLSFAQADTDARLVFVVLRGAVDGLAVAAPYGEARYQKLRGELAITSPGVTDGLLKLDGLFGLHPQMSNTFERYKNGEALIVHAVASPYRERSHFDGQDVLENGATVAGRRHDGWLNRAIAPLGGSIGNETAIALSQNTPLLLRGENSVTSWAPSRLPSADDDVIRRIEMLYAHDEFFATRLAQALESQQIGGAMEGMSKRRRGNQAAQFKSAMQSAAKFLISEDGPRIAVLEAGGWDTHANQGGARGALANKLSDLDSALEELRKGMGSHWRDTVVVLATEFGRTVAVNGTRGTDHGTATAALLLGGAVRGGRVIADWPGLGNADLYQGRDLKPTMDVRGIFKGVLADHLGLTESWLNDVVFPDSRSAKIVEGLIRI